MGMASKDIDFDEWFIKLKRNDTVCDEFGLSGLCQAFQRHTLAVTSHKIWTTILASHEKTPDEVRRLCDIHFLYMCRDTYSCLKPKFQWKREFPIGELELLPAPDTNTGPLSNIMEKTLDKESNISNIVKEEIQTDNETIPAEITTGITPEQALPSTSVKLPDAMQNLLVSLPLESDSELMDATQNVQGVTQPTDNSTLMSEAATVSELLNTIPCSINLTDISVKLVDGKMVLPSNQVPLEPQVIVGMNPYNLREWIETSTIETVRPKRKAASNINYNIVDVTSEEEETVISDSEQMNLPAKSALSGYRLATHEYMLAKHLGLIQGPITRTKALKIVKTESLSSVDSEAMEEYIETTQPTKRRRKSKPQSKPKKSGKLITRSYFLRKNGKGTSLPVKPKKETQI